MFEWKINLITLQDVNDFVKVAERVNDKVYIKSGDYKGNGKSILNVMAGLEWGDLYCQCDTDIGGLIDRFVK